MREFIEQTITFLLCVAVCAVITALAIVVFESTLSSTSTMIDSGEKYMKDEHDKVTADLLDMGVDLDSNTARYRMALHNIRRHIELTMKGNHKLSTVWQIANRELGNE